MQPMFRSHKRRYDQLEKATSVVTAELSETWASLVATNGLRRLDGQAPEAGSKPLVFLEDGRGKRYVLKLAQPGLVAAEETAYALRRLGRRPVVPAWGVSLEVEGLGVVEGLLKPYIDFDPQRQLSTDTRDWSELQRRVILLEHAWEWFLDNLDTNLGQYALLGSWGYPVNIDWDRSFATEGHSELSRFAKYKRTLPNARTFLYADFVERRLPLEFAVLMREARSIRRLSVTQVRSVLSRYARIRFDGEAERREFCDRILLRQKTIERECQEFVNELRRERSELARAARGQGGAVSRCRATIVQAWNGWQVVLDAAFKGPVGQWGRRALRFVRGRAAVAAMPGLSKDSGS